MARTESDDVRKRKGGEEGVKSDFLAQELDRISKKNDFRPSSKAPTFSDYERSAPKAKYPWYIIFILGNEICERFAFYGMKAVLTLYFLEVLYWSEGTSTLVYHVFLVFSYFTPIFGAMLADGYIGKFATIFSLSVVYVGGLALMTLSSIPPIGLDPVVGFVCGLLLVAVGTGGIKPCVVSYGGDQYKPGQEKQREQFFSVFYFCINAGSLVSTFVTPILRSDLPCLGKDGCYPAAFGLPAGLLAIAIILFVLGRPFYTNVPPTGNVLGRVLAAVYRAIVNKIKKRPPPGPAPTHWLDYAADKHSASFLGDIKQILPVLKMFLPLPIFWTLFDQKGSRWTLQANKMDGKITDDFILKPDQVQIFNPVLILILVPIFETIIYPLLERCNIKFRLLARMVVGMLFAGVAFVIAGVIQMQLAGTLPVAPKNGTAELRVFNTLPCPLSATFYNGTADLPESVKAIASFGVEDFSISGFWDRIPRNDSVFKISFQLDGSASCAVLNNQAWPTTQLDVFITNTETHSVYVSEFQGRLHIKRVVEKKEKPRKGAGFVRFIVPFRLNTASGGGQIALVNPTVPVGKAGHRYTLYLNRTDAFEKSVTILEQSVVGDQGKYELFLQDDTTPTGYRRFGKKEFVLRNGGVQTVLVKNEPDEDQPWAFTDIVEPSSLSVFWQIPQYFMITLAEVLFSVSGLAFAYSQSPTSMKAVLQAGWLMTVAFGNVIVIIISGAQLVQDQAVEFFVFAALTAAFALVFAFMTRFYVYVEKPKSEEPAKDIRRPSHKEEIDEALNND